MLELDRGRSAATLKACESLKRLGPTAGAEEWIEAALERSPPANRIAGSCCSA